MPRLLFEKKDNAIWISHLDLMRVFQRAFKRAGLPLTHTQGFNPRPSVSIALPLSVGIESCCELLDFDLDDKTIQISAIADKLNSALVSGVRVLDAYENAAKIKNLAFLNAKLSLEYDKGVPDGAVEQLTALFAREEVTVEKKNKNGVTEQNIIPMIKSLEAIVPDKNTVQIRTTICCQNPSLNPMQIHAAIVKYLPEYAPDFAACSREEIYDIDGNIFR